MPETKNLRKINMTSKLLLKIIFFYSIIIGALSAEVDEEKPVGLDKFKTMEIPTDGQICDLETVDFNQDGLKDIFITCIIKDRQNNCTIRKSAIYFQDKKNGFSNDNCIKWDFALKATAIEIGNFLTEPGVEIGYLTREGFFVYFIARDKNQIEIKNKKLLDINPIHIHPGKYTLQIWQKPIDIDKNGYDDIIIPTSNSYHVYFQESPGEKFIPCIIPVKNKNQISSSSGYSYLIKNSIPNLFIEDVNNDGIEDIILFNENTIYYYLQNGKTPYPERFSENPTGEYVVQALGSNLKTNELGYISLRIIDINKDSINDLAISIMQGGIEDINKLRTQLLFFWGKNENNGLPTYSYSPDQIITIKGVVPLLDFSDVNSDGKLDLIGASFQMDFSSNMQKAILRYLKLNYHVQLYQANKNQFPSNLDYEKSLNFPLDLIGKGKKYFSHIYFKDFNGDSKPDVLTISGPSDDSGKLNIRLAKSNKELSSPLVIGFYKDDYLLYRIKIPNETKIIDMNQDSKNDIILVYRSKFMVMLPK
jgi:hypothetical protein